MRWRTEIVQFNRFWREKERLLSSSLFPFMEGVQLDRELKAVLETGAEDSGGYIEMRFGFIQSISRDFACLLSKSFATRVVNSWTGVAQFEAEWLSIYANRQVTANFALLVWWRIFLADKWDSLHRYLVLTSPFSSASMTHKMVATSYFWVRQLLKQLINFPKWYKIDG